MGDAGARWNAAGKEDALKSFLTGMQAPKGLQEIPPNQMPRKRGCGKMLGSFLMAIMTVGNTVMLFILLMR